MEMSTVTSTTDDGLPFRATALPLRLTVPLVLGIIAVLLLSGNLAVVDAAQPSISTASAPGGQVGAAQLAAASASLAAGQGPADGQSISCSLATASTSASCSSPLAAASAGASTSTVAKWHSESVPNARAGAVMTYDTKDSYVLLFGGFNGSVYLGDTWEFTHGAWAELAPAVTPSPRANASIAYDTSLGYVVLFGGYNGAVLGDTWKYATGVWTQLTPATSPSARKDAVMTYDARDGYLVLFGGNSGSGALADTWTFAKGTWTQIFPSTSPGARWGSASAFDTADNYVLLFGGFSGTSFLGDTWEFATGQWTQLSPTVAPAARYQAGLAYDTNNSYVVLFGGASNSGGSWTAYGDTWEFKAGVWTLVSPTDADAPAARQAAGVTYDAFDKYMLVSDGLVDGSPLIETDTWEYHTGVWRQIVSGPDVELTQPAGRYGAAASGDPADNYRLLFGGTTGYGPNGETWIFTEQDKSLGVNPSSGYQWIELFPSTAPSPRTYAAMTYDAKDGYVVLFGGMTKTGAALGDTWTFSAGVWTQLNPSPTPAPRYGAMMAYDVADGYVLLFGGTNGASYFSDTWTFQGGAWTQLSPAVPPVARAFGGLAWDNDSLYTTLYGGTTGSAALGDTWKFLAGAWTSLKPTGTPTLPPAEWGMTFVADLKPGDKGVFMFGGCTMASVSPLNPSCPSADTQGTTWKYGVGNWMVVTTKPVQTGIPAAPAPRFFAFGAYDPYDGNVGQTAQNVILSDGISAGGTLITDRWIYDSLKWNNWFPALSPSPRYGDVFGFEYLSEKSLMFGGIGPVSGGKLGYLDDTWIWDTGIWGQANPKTPPSARAFASLAYYGQLPCPYPGCKQAPHALNYSVMFGGVGATGYLGDTWKWVGSAPGGQWTELHPSTAPSPRANASMVYDQTDNYVVLFGGQNSGGYLGDTWTYNLNGEWTKLSETVSPSVRAGAAMDWDKTDGYVVLFGGYNGVSALGDTWKFVGGTWTQLTPTTSPSPRYGAMIVDDPLGEASQAQYQNFVLMYGGYTGSVYLSDTWSFIGGEWTVLPTDVPGPTPAAFGGLSNDFDDGHPSLWSGIGPGGVITGMYWEYYSTNSGKG